METNVTCTNFMRQFMTEHSNGGTNAPCDGSGEGRANGQAVTEVVDPIPKDHHPSNCCHVLWNSGIVGMRVTMGAAQFPGFSWFGFLPVQSLFVFNLLHKNFVLVLFLVCFLGEEFQCFEMAKRKCLSHSRLEDFFLFFWFCKNCKIYFSSFIS